MNADTPVNDLVLHALQRHHRGPRIAGRHRHDARAHPLRARRAGSRAGDYFVQVCEFGDGNPPAEPRTYTGTVTSTRARPRPLPRALARVPGQPAAEPARARSVEQPEQRHAREHVLAPEHDAGGLRHASSATSPRARRGTSARDRRADEHDLGNNARSAESWLNGRRPGPEPVPAGERRRATTRSRGPTSGSPRTAIRARRTRELRGRARASTSRRRSMNLFTVHNRMHDFVLPARLHRGELQRAGVELRPHRGLPGERPGAR